MARLVGALVAMGTLLGPVVASAQDKADPLPTGLTRTPDGPAPEKPGGPRYLPEDESSVRLQMRRLSFNLASAFKSLPGEGKFQTIAVLPFTEQGDEAKDREIGKLVTAEMASFFKRDHGLWLVERDQIEDALHEAYLSETGLTDGKSAVKLGEMLAAQALVVGEVSVVGANYLVNARILGTESGEVFTAEQAEIPAADLVSFASDSVVLRTTAGAVFRSALIPGWGQFYNRQSPKGFTILGMELGLAGGAVASHLVGMAQHQKYVDTGDLAFIENEKNLYRLRNIVIGVAVAVWAYNVFDAWLNGESFGDADE